MPEKLMFAIWFSSLIRKLKKAVFLAISMSKVCGLSASLHGTHEAHTERPITNESMT